MRVKDKNVFITGANRGMGKDFALQAAKKGAFVHLLIRKEAPQLVEELKSFGAKDVKVWKMDMLDQTGIEETVQKILNEGYTFDVLINNAGLLTGGLLEKQDPKDIQDMLQVNLFSLIYLTRRVLPEMLKLPEAKIVNNSSVSGIMTLPCASTYAAAKAGVVAFTRSLQEELRPTNVSTLVLITPGVKTEMYDQISEYYSENLDLSWLSSIPSQQWAERVFKHIESDEEICWPQGGSRVGVWFAKHWPSMFNSIVQTKFHR